MRDKIYISKEIINKFELYSTEDLMNFGLSVEEILYNREKSEEKQIKGI